MKKMKRFKIVAVALVLAMALGTAASAVGSMINISVAPGVKVNINGQEVAPVRADGSKQEVFLFENSTYVPLRWLADLMGLKVDWNEAEGTALLTGDVPNLTGGVAADGTYTAKAFGRNGYLTVETVISDGRIASVTVTEHTETAGIADGALKYIPSRIVENNSVNVDAIAGATLTSDAILNAVKDCITQAGGNVKDFSAAAPVEQEKPGKTYTCDVVVVGAGASGCTAATAAANEGAKVILMEKTATIGGCSNLSSSCTFYNAPPTVEAGKEVDLEQTIPDWIKDCHYRVDAACIRQYVTKSGDTYQWLLDRGYVTTYSAMGYRLPDYSEREPMFRGMLDNSVVKGGGEILTECTAYELITDASGAVVGVKGKMMDGTIVEVRAKAVIMATGGYGANKEMVEENFGFGGVNGGLGQNIGEGLEMVWAVGGKKPDNFGGQMLHQTLARATNDLKKQFSPFESIYPMILAYVPSLMNVSPAGARFRDETATLTAVAAANTSAFNGPYHYVIVSKQQIDGLIESGLNSLKVPRRPGLPPLFYADCKDEYTVEAKWETVYAVLDAMVADGNGYKGNTPEELAKNAGMDVDTFVDEFNRYQEACANGVDPDFGKSADYLLSMGDEGPYYAITAEVNNLGSVGGMLINKNFQILNDDRVAIPGLYAVGSESLGVMYNDTYVGAGVGMGYAMTSGRLGGAVAAKNALGK